MMKPSVRLSGLFIVLCFLLCAGCTPGTYKQPLRDFDAAVSDAEVIYFNTLESRKTAEVTLSEIAYKVKIEREGIHCTEEVRKELEADIIAKKDRPAIPEQSLKIRKLLFETLHLYTKTLVALAEDEGTDGLKAEIELLTKDVNSLLKKAEVIEGFGKASKWLDKLDVDVTLTVVKNILNLLVDVISDIAREAAIREALAKTQPDIELAFTILSAEAGFAFDAAKIKMIEACKKANVTFETQKRKDGKKETKYFNGKVPINEPAFKAIMTIQAECSVSEKSLEGKRKAILKSFQSVLDIQNELIRKAAFKDLNDHRLKIKRIKEYIVKAKAIAETLKN